MTLTLENGAQTATRVGLSGVTEALADVTSAVVVGESSPGTALAAIAAGRAMARTRIVTIVDLIGDVPPLRALAEDDDPHGVSDCFEYGISPKAVTRRTHANDQMFVISGGTEQIDYAHVMPSERWARLIAEYQKAGALLVFVAVARSPGLAQLIARTDGVIAVGAVEGHLPAGAKVLANATPPPRRIVARRLDEDNDAGNRWGRRLIIVGAAAAVAFAAWLFLPRRASVPAVASAAQTRPADTVTSSASAQLGAPVAGPTPREPGPAAYATRIYTAPTYAAALNMMRDSATTARGAATVIPVTDSSGTLRYEVITGAYEDSATALAQHTGSVVHVPLALRLADSLPLDSARTLTAQYVKRGVPAYSLEITKGLAAIYAGAFAAGDDALPLITSLRKAGFNPVLVLRTGRP